MKRPRTRTHFHSTPDELNYLSEIAWYFASTASSQSSEAISCMKRFSELLESSGVDDGSIMLQDHWALFHEMRADIPAAIRHREREIELIERLFEIGGPVDPINYAFLARTMEKLLDCYSRKGEQTKADNLRTRIDDVRLKT